MQHSEAFLKLVNASRARIRETSVDDVSRRLQAGEKLTLVDVREDGSLRLNQAIVKAFDGERVLDPWHVYLKPIHRDPNTSWFASPKSGGLRLLPRLRIPFLGGLRQAAPFPRANDPTGKTHPGGEGRCL